MDGTNPEFSRTGRISICMDSQCQEVTDVWLHNADMEGELSPELNSFESLTVD